MSQLYLSDVLKNKLLYSVEIASNLAIHSLFSHLPTRQLVTFDLTVKNGGVSAKSEDKTHFPSSLSKAARGREMPIKL